MPAVLIDSQGRPLSNGTGVYTTDDVYVPPRYTGTVDVEGLTALGWDSYDIAWLQENVWWDKEDNDYWKVTEANLSFGPNGSTPLTWANRATIKDNPDVRYFPKFDPSPSSNTSWGSLFGSYLYLYAIPTHGWDTTKVTSFNALFQHCYNLRSVGDLTNWSTVALTSTAFASTFYNCFNLTNIGDLSGWTTSNVTNMSNMFNGCKHLNKIGDLSNWNTAKVTNMANMFYSCYRVDNLGDFSNWDVSKVTSMASMFQYCTNLKKISGLSGWNTGAVTNMSYMFYYCSQLSYIDDLTNWNTSNVTNMNYMFACCTKLVRFGDLSKWNTSKVTSLYYMFSTCFLLNNIGDLSEWDVSKINGTNTSSGIIGMFNSCYSLQSVGDLSNWTFDMSGTKNQMNNLFSNCVNISKLNIKDWDVSKVINFTYTFNLMNGLSELDISGWDLSANTNSGTSASTSIFANDFQLKVLKLGPKFFNGTPETYYFNHLQSWTRESIVESLYTNQTLRDSNSTAITINLASAAYSRLTAEDKTNIASKNITLVSV